jgi:hypothetical protein
VRAGYDERGRDFIGLDADPERPQRNARHDGPRKATPEQSQRLFAIDRYANQDEIGLIENYKTNPIFLRDGAAFLVTLRAASVAKDSPVSARSSRGWGAIFTS